MLQGQAAMVAGDPEAASLPNDAAMGFRELTL